ncbi:hypothetical protein DWB61_10410 [Ancylomarina euxinus]|uniref:Uncharacterized protein n=1 Tax=Ancylomarina euxinus TaxID=2283627 RepID=A0A425Y0E9_9BACT|nr:hypothetical protein [Ancylomarina euxinus]MCZ4695239.1 hypothetical protein [Ancylomarina euxinus]MUP15436.1 hypothetical protein [Ancylomarina euxinus]RRG21146.1 hypothetical protein DWB61_10410 [Ancylomarina euxinus]
MERTEFINYIFDALYAQPENESLDIACWGMEHLHTEDDSPIYESIIEEFISNEWAVDQGLGFLVLTKEGRDIINVFGSYTAFIETYMQPAPQIKSPLSLKTISLVINLILALFIAMLMITKNNDDQIISDQKAKIEAQQATINSLQKATTK